jgi:hypothetical protein
LASQQPLQLLRRQGIFWLVPQLPAALSAMASAAARGATARNEVKGLGVCTKAPN